ncbi:MAG: cytochrome b N-terminal domain-containing protein [Acidobacteria bacterium]|nr:cytochrome b N-terminal domain-containing protein [Acidobacteriota bacterium]
MNSLERQRKRAARLRDWLTGWTRLPEIADALYEEPARGFKAWARTTAGIVCMLLAVQVITGALLSFYFVPSAESAHATVSYIEKVVPAGAWMRALHHYGSQWLTLFLALHLLQMFWRASYRRRTVGWIASVLLLAFVMAGGATGYSLPWDARAFFSTRVAEGIAGGLPLLGDAVHRWLLGGTEISTVTVSRFFAVHALVNPTLIILVIAARFFIFKERGVSDDESRAVEAERPESWKREQFARQVFAAGVVFAAIAFYALRHHAPLGPAASDAASGYLPRPGAQFLWLFQMLKYLPGRLASIVAASLPGLIFLGLAALPFIDARSRRKTSVTKPRRVSVALFALLFAFITLMTALAYLKDARDPAVRAQLEKQAADEAAFRSEPFEPQRFAPADIAATPSPTPAASPSVSSDGAPAAYIKECANCHGAQGQGVKPFPKLLGVSQKPRRTVEDIIGLLNDPVAYGLEPPMKSFAAKLTDDEKRQIAEYVVTLKKK